MPQIPKYIRVIFNVGGKVSTVVLERRFLGLITATLEALGIAGTMSAITNKTINESDIHNAIFDIFAVRDNRAIVVAVVTLFCFGIEATHVIPDKFKPKLLQGYIAALQNTRDKLMMSGYHGFITFDLINVILTTLADLLGIELNPLIFMVCAIPIALLSTIRTVLTYNATPHPIGEKEIEKIISGDMSTGRIKTMLENNLPEWWFKILDTIHVLYQRTNTSAELGMQTILIVGYSFYILGQLLDLDGIGSIFLSGISGVVTITTFAITAALSFYFNRMHSVVHQLKHNELTPEQTKHLLQKANRSWWMFRLIEVFGINLPTGSLQEFIGLMFAYVAIGNTEEVNNYYIFLAALIAPLLASRSAYLTYKESDKITKELMQQYAKHSTTQEIVIEMELPEPEEFSKTTAVAEEEAEPSCLGHVCSSIASCFSMFSHSSDNEEIGDLAYHAMGNEDNDDTPSCWSWLTSCFG